MKLPKSAKYLLFDMDGTLVDTEPIGPKIFINQLNKYGVSPTDDEKILFTKIWRRDGTDIKQDDWLPEIARKYSIGKSSEDFLREFYVMYKESIEVAPALPGVENFLHKINASGIYKTALVTASKFSQVETVLLKHIWQEIFDVVVTSDDFSHHKPDPESYIAGIRRLNAHPEQCVVFEDSKNGTIAGAVAGCFVIGIRVGNSIEQDLSNANVIVDSFSDIELLK